MHECPSCHRPTVQRLGGPWCAYCKAWIVFEQRFGEEAPRLHLWTKTD
jgi:ribosomal protein L37AE/L43A